ncbi:MAG: TIGR02757 family protein [Deltaproteobacteria bacterium]|nr:TIGR02757 family protein [Deltaproteobacteria bacterium]
MTPEMLKKRMYNRRDYVHPDPLEFLYLYKEIRDREIVGLIASSLAYGRVKQILKFTHRFATGDHLAGLLWGIKNVIARFGSLNECFCHGLSPDDDTVIPAIIFFTGQLITGKSEPGHLVALPEKGSACKRMNLFLRWMVRKDRVDPGGWKNVPLSKLVIPLDTHMHKISLKLGLTAKKQANMNTALEITSCFKQLVPDDPVKYDFVLTRLGIRDDMDINLICP